MTEQKDKSKSHHQFARQFISPYSLEVCCSRLKDRCRPPSRRQGRWTASRPYYRIELWNEDEDSIHFEVFKAVRPAVASKHIDVRSTRALGTLLRQADGTTQVLVNAGTTVKAHVSSWMLLIIIIALMIVGLLSFAPLNGSIAHTVSVVVILTILISAIYEMNKAFRAEHLDLLAVVEKILR